MERYEILKDIGFGNFGAAKLVRDKSNGELYAVKYIARGQKIDELVQREIMNHRSLKHPNIIRFKESWNMQLGENFLTEYVVPKDSVKTSSTSASRVRTLEESARCFFQQLISGVIYCHSMQICDRDLRLGDTLLDGSSSPRLKICAFGYSNSSVLQSKPRSTLRTPVYIAPEVLTRGESDGKIVDVFYCGVTLYMMLVGACPSKDPEDPHNYRETIKRLLNVHYSIPHCVTISLECKHLLSRIFVADPETRITIPKIKKHPWFLKNLSVEFTEEALEGIIPGNGEDGASQSIEETLSIVQEARQPGEWQFVGGSLDIDELDTDLDIDDF